MQKSGKQGTKSLTSQTLILSLGRSVSMVVNVFLPLTLVRLLTPHDYGIYKFFFLLLGTIGTFACLGMAQSLYYFIPKYWAGRRVYITQSFAFMLGVGGFILILGTIFTPLGACLFKAPHNYLIYWILLFSILGFVVYQPTIPTLLSVGNVGFASGMIAMMDFISAAALLAGMLIGGDAIYLFSAFGVFQLVRMIFVLCYSHAKFGLSLLITSKETWLKQLRYAIPFGAANIAGYLQVSLHQFIVAFFFNPAIFAIYSVASFQLPIVRVWYGSIADMILIRMTDLLAKNDVNGVISVWLNSIRKLGMVFVPLFLYLFLYADLFVITLFTSKYYESVPIFRIFLFNMFFFCVNCHSVLRASNQTDFILRVNIVTLLFSAFCLYFLTKYWGVMGAAITSILTLLLANSIQFIRIAKTLNEPVVSLIPFREIAKITISSSLAGAAALAIKYLIKANGFWIQLLILAVSFAIFSLIYCFSAWKIGVLDADEKRQISRTLGRLIPLALRRGVGGF